ncbi:MAG: 3'-5' exonuclease [Planctomycetota bacterium]
MSVGDRALVRRFLAGRDRLAVDLPRDVEAWWRELPLDLLLGPTRARFAEEREEARAILARFLAELGEEDARAALARAELDGGLAGPSTEESRAGVALMTLHASKGLEFDHVFISGANEGLVPLAAARGEEGRGEERRLFFVGLTRARESVEIGWFTQAPGFSAQAEASSFLALIPAVLLDRRDLPAKRPESTSTSSSPTGSVETVDMAASIATGSRTAAAGPTRTAPAPLAVGDRVRHPELGSGEIVSADEAEIRCRFARGRERTFSRFFCPLVREAEGTS